MKKSTEKVIQRIVMQEILRGLPHNPTRPQVVVIESIQQRVQSTFPENSSGELEYAMSNFYETQQKRDAHRPKIVSRVHRDSF